jgi:hypothetical protein
MNNIKEKKLSSILHVSKATITMTVNVLKSNLNLI